jgi:pilus assembly protein CpaB
MPSKFSKIKINRFALMVVTAFLLAGAAAFLAVHYLQHRESSYRQRLERQILGRLIGVVVPKENLPAGTLATGQDFAIRQVPKDLVYPDTITVVKWPLVANHHLTRPVLKGLPLLTRDFVKPFGDDFAAAMPPGKRAVTIDVSGENRLAGLIRPGNRVDLLLLIRGRNDQGGRLIPLIHHALVVATGKHTRFVPIKAFGPEVHYANQILSQYDSLTLELTPAQAAVVVLAQRVGTIRVILVPKAKRTYGVVPALTAAQVMSNLGLAEAKGYSTATVQYIVGTGTARMPLTTVAMGSSAPVPTPRVRRVPSSANPKETERMLEQYLKVQQAMLKHDVMASGCPPDCRTYPVPPARIHPDLGR